MICIYQHILMEQCVCVLWTVRVGCRKKFADDQFFHFIVLNQYFWWCIKYCQHFSPFLFKHIYLWCVYKKGSNRRFDTEICGKRILLCYADVCLFAELFENFGSMKKVFSFFYSRSWAACSILKIFIKWLWLNLFSLSHTCSIFLLTMDFYQWNNYWCCYSVKLHEKSNPIFDEKKRTRREWNDAYIK